MVKIDKKWCYFHLKWCYLRLRWCYFHLRWCYLRRWLGCSIDFAFSALNFAENPKKFAEIYLHNLPLFACMPTSTKKNLNTKIKKQVLSHLTFFTRDNNSIADVDTFFSISGSAAIANTIQRQINTSIANITQRQINTNTKRTVNTKNP